MLHTHLLAADAAEQAALKFEAICDFESAVCFAAMSVTMHTRISLLVDCLAKKAIDSCWDGDSEFSEEKVRRGVYDNAAHDLRHQVAKMLGSPVAGDFSPHIRIIYELKERL